MAVAYSIDTAISDFEVMIQSVADRVAQKPQYLAAKEAWPSYLLFLQPIVTGKYIFSAEAIEYAQPRFQVELTSIQDQHVQEKALYLGVMSASTLAVYKKQHKYPTINLDELSKRWLSETILPVESLQNYGFFERVNTNGLDALLQGFLRLHIQPLIKNPNKAQDALSHFETQFFSGILLDQITTFLIMRDL